MKNVLEVSHLSKSIKGKKIIKDVSFCIEEGKIFGFLGPNGSGKTTTIRMLVQLIKPDSGSIKICGELLGRGNSQAMAKMGCLIESPDLYDFLSGYENLMQFVRMDSNLTKSRLHEVAEIVGMQDRLHDKVETYSLGMKQRLGIAQAILTKPMLLILDEPTNGLDPEGVNQFRELLRKLSREENMGIFISSHLLSEVQLLCDKIAILSQGKIISSSIISDYQNDDEYCIQTEDVEKAQNLIKNTFDLNALQTKRDLLLVKLTHHPIHEVVKHLIEARIVVKQFYLKPLSLEELFLELTRGNKIV